MSMQSLARSSPPPQSMMGSSRGAFRAPQPLPSPPAPPPQQGPSPSAGTGGAVP
jgi:hypothetical protein